ncbi:heavy-metal-associated domain-containing protein [Halomonas sp. MCCC 1A17488]|uniref:Heavy-metal-associated domain-containing protein n=1 Tax=Billgrantia sulfidoxydans TaxID=2733484 RepID=A0ABX7W8D8_9GAMM|nr:MULTISPECIES: heavy-metal-associated domain-containing protein [Halomonas]MCE8018200.1 heavy-metal-associated domain-containing protein [Halomonas sp. MCCC 1A17488]MCG3241533.1 heavy-metal-associated domain-containing protein [Halomonas sp. MCCC 1A17488]QPP48515.1 heavy-metal-associated domain-containing protein [Halomonas sp. SS10-MC5]QTP55827.1 heavy-metal-associated domain-containing protein [Halomonas sulfidoxydans]
MPKFNVPDMSCNHCVSTISTAIESVDSGASLEFDLANRQVSVNSSAPVEAIQAAIEAAGYPNQVA